MITEHLSQLRKVLGETDGLPEATREELLRLIHAAEAEAGALLDVEAEGNHGPATQAEDREPSVLGQLKTSLEELEVAHPEATAAVNRVASALANMGI